MLINLCHHSVKTLIKTDKVCFDNYDVLNLISEDPSAAGRGFISDHFIKPPVNITVQFPCNIAIFRIVIDPVVGQQKSCYMKIFTASQAITDSWLYDCSTNQLKTDGVIFNHVGTVNQNDPAVVCCENKLFKTHGYKFRDPSSYPYTVNLNSRKPGGLTNVSHVTICIQRSKGGKAVAVKSLEIWGVPSAKVPTPVKLKLKNIYSESVSQTCKSSQDKGEKLTEEIKDGNNVERVSVSSQELETIQQDGVSIPEDFIDQITCDIMCIPVLLPSGKIVDQSTLDKFISIEASWGRTASDPFTGLAFTPASNPVVNSSLKARIDQFVLNHSNVLRCARTLGHSNNGAHASQPKTLKSSRLLTDVSTDDNDSRNVTSSFTGKADQHSSSASTSSRKRKFECVDLTIKSEISKEAKMCSYTNSPLPPSEISYKQTSVAAGKQQRNHKNTLNESLDFALSSALTGLPSFSRTATSRNSADSRKMMTVNECCKCQVQLDASNVVMYRLPCKHVICRNCIAKCCQQTICGKCNKTYKSNEVVRIF